METAHENSHDCRTHSERHGGRRRRCVICGRTWTAHPRRRGRRRRRIDPRLPDKLLVDKEPARRLIRLRQCSASTFYRHARAAFDRLAARPFCPLLATDQQFVLLADGLWFDFQGREAVLYNFVLRPVREDIGYLLDPVLLPGKEYEKTWRQAIGQAVDPVWQERICALVVDGFRGAGNIATDRGWIYQRCHWHLLSVLKGMSGGRRRQIHGRVIRQTIYRLAREVITTMDEGRVPALCNDLRDLARDEYLRNRRMRYVVGNLLKDIDCLRAYIRHPELRLPTTTDAVESLHALMRIATSRVNNLESAVTRARCLVPLHPTIICRPNQNPQI